MKRLFNFNESSKEKFIESLNVLQLLLSEKEVSFKGKYYDFEPITIMPRPISNPVPIMIEQWILKLFRNTHPTKGFHVQSTLLSGTKELLIKRVNAFKEGCKILGEKGKTLKLSILYAVYMSLLFKSK